MPEIELDRRQWEALVTTVIDLGVIPSDEYARAYYVGRDMVVGGSDTCIGFIFDSDVDIVMFSYHLDELLDRAGLGDFDVNLFIHGCCSDSHGQSAILYFPQISVEALPAPVIADEEDEDDDAEE